MRLFANAHKALAAEVSRLEGLKDLHEEIKRAGSLERLVGEVEAQKKDADAKLAKVGEDVKTAQATLSGLQAQAEAQREANINQAEDFAAELERDKEIAKVILDQAKRDTEQVLAAAKAEGERIIAEAQAWFERCNKEAAEVAEVVKVARKDLAATEQRKADVEGEIARLQKLFAPKQ